MLTGSNVGYGGGGVPSPLPITHANENLEAIQKVIALFVSSAAEIPAGALLIRIENIDPENLATIDGNEMDMERQVEFSAFYNPATQLMELLPAVQVDPNGGEIHVTLQYPSSSAVDVNAIF